MATLTGQRIKDSYKDLLQVSNSNSGIDSTLRTISDGEATDSVLQLSSVAVNISSAGALQYAGVAITSTAAELNILDGATITVAELNILDGVTSTAAELNILDGVTSTAAELNVLDGYTGSVTELNYLDTLHATGVTATEFDYLDGVTSSIQTQLDSKISATLTQEQVEDFVGGMLDGTETGISVSYDDTNGNIDFVVTSQTDENFTTADHSKLDGIEASATADQTASEIKTLVGNASDSNVFTDADHSKLDGIEASADVTDATNVTAAGALMDSEVTNLSLVKGLTSGISNGNVLVANSSVADNDFLKIDGTSVEGRTAAEIRSDLNVEDGATADQTNAEIRTAVDAASDSNVFTDDDHSKLNAIEASADVTDTANVTSAGALMDSELTSIADVKALDQSVVSGATPTFTTTNFTDASNKRFMTDAQETKLDSVESNATADQTAEEIQDIVGAMFTTTNTETGITATYQDSTGDIDLVVQTLNQDTTGNAATATKIASITNSDIVQLTDTQTLSNKTIASPTFTGDVTFNDASTPQLKIKDTTNNVLLDLRTTDTLAAIGTTTDSPLHLKQNGAFHLSINSTQIILNASGEDRDTIIKDSSGNVIFKVDAANSDVDITTLDVSGDADIDGTLEADAITVGGTALNTVIAGVTVANATLAATTTVSNSTANTNFPVVFHDESNALLDDTGALRYNPSTGTLLVPNLSVAGTTTTVDTVTMQAANAIIFEGATADAHETTLSIVDPTADHTQYLINQGGYIPVLAAATTTAITSTPAELNVLDGITSTTAELNILDGVTATTAELNIMDGVTATTAELNVLDGYTGSVTELNYLDTLHATGVTSTEFDYLDGVTSNIQTQLDAKIEATLTTEQVQDIAGPLVASGGTKTGITVTYDDTNNNMDFVVGTLNQDTTGNAATATALETARTIHGVSFDGTANIDLSEVVQDTAGGMFSSNTETFITATYQDADGTVDLVVPVKDEDNFSSDSASHLATQQSIKAYVDGEITSAGAGDITAVTAGSGLTGGATTGAATLNIGAGTGIDVATDAISVDVSDFMSNGSNNRVLTATGTDAMNAESTLTWNGSDYLTVQSADDSEGGIRLEKSTTDGSHTKWSISHRDDNQSLIIYSYDGTTFRNWITLDEPNALLKLGSNTSNLVTINSSAQIAAASLDISGDVDVDGTLETDALTINGVTLAETISDTVGAMVGSNTESGITVAYQDADNTLDFTVGTLNQDTTGNAATATALATARNIHGVSFDGTGNIDLSEVIQDTVGAMFSSNTETRITATYQDGDGTIDLVVDDLDTDTQLTTENVQDIVGAMFGSNTETRISATYQDGDGTIDLVVDDMTANDNTTYTGGTNLTLSGTTFNVDDAFLKNNADDTTSGTITAGGFTTSGNIDVDGTANLDNTDIDGTLNVSGVFDVDDIHGRTNDTNRLSFDDDTQSGIANGVSLTGINHLYLCCDESNNGTGAVKFFKGTDNDLDSGTRVELAQFDNSGNLSFREDSTTQTRYIHMPRGGGITFYGDKSVHHGIFSRDDGNSAADDLLISSYGAVYIDLDSNDNNTSGASFEIGRHNAANSPFFVVDGEDGEVTLASFVLDGNTISGIDDSGEFTNDDNHIMTSAGVEDKILGYGYTTNTGDITGVTAGTGLSGGGTSSGVTLNLDVGDLGLVGNGSLDSATNTEAEYAALPVGYAKMMHSNLGTDEGMPLDSQYFYFKKIANRDSGGGWGAIALGYNNNEQFYIGNTTVSSAFATWSRVVVEDSNGIATSPVQKITSGDDFALGELTNNLRMKGNSTTGFNFLNSGNGWAHLNCGNVVAAGSVSIGGHAMADIDIGSEFTDTDDHLMSSGAIKEKIEDYGYTTNTGDITAVTVTAGTGLTGGGAASSGAYSETLNVIGGDGITANANDVAITAAQTTITSVKNASLVVGRDSHNGIHFSTDNAIKVEVNDVQDEFRFASGGTFHADADIIAYSSTTASDKRLKENIEELPYGLDDVMKMKPVQFDWKKDEANGKERGHDIGVIAQEMEEIVPEVVKEYEGLQGKDDFKAVDYSKIVPVLIKSIQELKEEIEELKK